MLHELALLPQLIEGSTIEGDAGIGDLEEKVGAYDRWVVRNRIAPSAAATALENAVRNGPVEAPHGTRPAAKDEAIAILRAIVSDVHEARGLVQRIEAALLRVGNLEARGRELLRGISMLAEKSDRMREPPGLYRAPIANVYRAMQLEADVLARVARSRSVMHETATRTWRLLECVESSIVRFVEEHTEP